MAIFRTQINYIRSLNEKWSNVYHVVADSITDAHDAWLATGVPDLLPPLDTSCTLASVLTSDPSSTAFITSPVNEPGTSSASGDLLPLFNAAKVIIPVGLFGRPDLKYLKGFITESVQTGGTINSGTQTFIVDTFNQLITDMVAAGQPLCDAVGTEYTVSSVQPAVQMRQMHRKRKRTPAP